MLWDMTPSLFSFGRNRRETVTSDDVREGSALVASPPAETTAVAVEAPAPPVPEPSSPRSQAVEDALAAWREELVDLGGVASLDDITLLDGVVDLTAAHPSGIAQLYAGRVTHLSSLVRERGALGVARQSLREVAGRTEVLARQFGVAPVYLAIGVASWTQDVVPDTDDEALGLDSHDDEDALADIAAAPAPLTHSVNAPVLLRPVRLAATNTDTAITLDPSIEINPVLTRALRDAGSSADVEAIARASLSAEGFTPRAALTRIGSLGRRYLRDFVVHERLVIGAFVHPEQALVEDFDATLERSRASALVAALAGDEPARNALDVALPVPQETDRAPECERGVGDLDVAQLAAVEAVSSGASILLDAPPGSDVAETLAAVVADAAASGRTVLHVPATSADGHAVARALDELGLGGMVLDLTEDPAWRRHAAEAIKDSLGALPPELDVPAIVDLRDRLTALRERLAGSVDALHEVREPWGVSAYVALQRLAELTTGRARTRTSARVSDNGLPRLDEAGRERALRLLHRAHELGVLTQETTSSAWNGLTVADIDEATDALSRMARLADELLPELCDNVTDVAASTGMTRATTLAEWSEQLEVLDGIRDSLDVFLPEVFERSAADLVVATATKQWRERRSVQMSAYDRRRFTKQAKDLVRPGRSVGDLHAELVKVQHRRETWRKHNPDGGWPRLPQGLDAMEATAAQAREAVERLQPLFATAEGSPVLMELELSELLERVRVLADDDVTAQRLPEINRVVGELGELGLGSLLADLVAREVAQEELDDELTYCWWASLLSRILREDRRLAGLDTGVLADRAEVLRDLDTMQVDTLPGPVGQAWANRVRTAVEADKQQARSLYVALSREDGVPLREILAEHPVAMVAKPVWIVPPTLVPQVFDPQAVLDLAVLDASAPVPVSQVLPAFVRAEQVLVVGDPRRATSGLASELGPLLPSVTLPTTRNTLDAEIAAFLARNGYEGVVEAVPAPPGAPSLCLDLVDGRGMPAPGQTAVESVPAEVERVVDLVIEHALTHPEQSLGVVALNTRHAEVLRRATVAAAAGSPALESFFAGGVTEPFVVVDLGEARSLRRDHVIISVGYAKTPHGRTIHSFGAVSGAGGMVGLVESLCASRGTTRVVSSLAAEDIDPDRLHAPGARLLREVLARAAGNGMGEIVMDEQSPDRLLVELAERLWRKGLTVVPRYGVEGGTRIPLAIGHPDYPGELFVAVLTDDADYAAQRSLRRRDRHWVERLRRRGWRVHMAFAVSVFIDAEAEACAIENQVLAVLTARAEAAAPPVAAVPARVEEPVETVRELPVVDDGAVTQEPAPQRGRRPPIAQGLPLQAYSDDQLDDLVAWIRSDGVEREETAEVEELRETLGLLRRGSGIDAVLANAVRRTRP